MRHIFKSIIIFYLNKINSTKTSKSLEIFFKLKEKWKKKFDNKFRITNNYNFGLKANAGIPIISLQNISKKIANI